MFDHFQDIQKQQVNLKNVQIDKIIVKEIETIEKPKNSENKLHFVPIIGILITLLTVYAATTLYSSKVSVETFVNPVLSKIEKIRRTLSGFQVNQNFCECSEIFTLARKSKVKQNFVQSKRCERKKFKRKIVRRRKTHNHEARNKRNFNTEPVIYVFAVMFIYLLIKALTDINQYYKLQARGEKRFRRCSLQSYAQNHKMTKTKLKAQP